MWCTESGNIHALHRLSNRTVLWMTRLDHYSEGWSCWTLEHRVRHDHISLQWLRLIVSETVLQLDLQKACVLHFFMHHLVCTHVRIFLSLLTDAAIAHKHTAMNFTRKACRPSADIWCGRPPSYLNVGNFSFSMPFRFHARSPYKTDRCMDKWTDGQDP